MAATGATGLQTPPDFGETGRCVRAAVVNVVDGSRKPKFEGASAFRAAGRPGPVWARGCGAGAGCAPPRRPPLGLVHADRIGADSELADVALAADRGGDPTVVRGGRR